MQDYKVMKERLFELMKWHTQLFSPKTTAVCFSSSLEEEEVVNFHCRKLGSH